ncbi:hypothetical protein OH492_10470 [Vibrio chagasii]|nr:hypothetical protein [Vibrio chagasii]
MEKKSDLHLSADYYRSCFLNNESYYLTVWNLNNKNMQISIKFLVDIYGGK